MDYTSLKSIINRIELLSDKNISFGQYITVGTFLSSKIVKNGVSVEWEGNTYYLAHPKDFFLEVLPKEQLYENDLFENPIDYYDLFLEHLSNGKKVLEEYKKNISFIEVSTPFVPRPILILNDEGKIKETEQLLKLKRALIEESRPQTYNLIEVIRELEVVSLEKELFRAKANNLKTEKISKV